MASSKWTKNHDKQMKYIHELPFVSSREIQLQN